MIITRIQQLNKTRYRIYIDDRSFCVLYKSELAAYGIVEGEIITEETCELIKTEVLTKRARLRAMNLLMKHSFTERKLREKLIEGGYPDEIIDDALQYVIGYGYVDDRAFARDYITSHNQDKSIRRMVSDLTAKGVSRDIIDDVLTSIDGTADAVDEEEQIRRLLTKRRLDISDPSTEQLGKIYSYLTGRGYSAETIRKVLRNTPEEIS